ncbi:hypothetical protein QRX60_28565 [Amycolatopsis mongoliensis]|uniref:Uncharacterized protein n=1 Tax=Amycolatopsis mongoliensis TaxID=715475 RepID=A0A9Y2JIJ9_9PSEU|nr:hypothetical protein [Amycolatopsis sp. 4-36]WIX98026.1 hypothetical protein QRX60_28565 [Amycolatopsis sp. 4-36]
MAAGAATAAHRPDRADRDGGVRGGVRVGGGANRIPANLILALTNARLGIWFANPRRLLEDDGSWTYPRPARLRRLHYLLREIFALHPSELPLVFVSDGAHYENLGLVELLRHRCGEIYCFDASSDTETFATSISKAIILAYDELGVRIELHDPELADPRPADATSGPDKLDLLHRLAKSPVITGKITYPGLDPAHRGREGILVIGRAVLDPGTPGRSAGMRPRTRCSPTTRSATSSSTTRSSMPTAVWEDMPGSSLARGWTPCAYGTARLRSGNPAAAHPERG